MGNRIHGNTSYEPLTTFLRLSLQSGRWTRMSKSKKMQKIDIRGDNFTYMETCPRRWRYKTAFGVRDRVADVIICFIFYRNRLRGFRAVRGQKWGSSIDFDRRPYKRSALRCCLWNCDAVRLTIFVLLCDEQSSAMTVWSTAKRKPRFSNSWVSIIPQKNIQRLCIGICLLGRATLVGRVVARICCDEGQSWKLAHGALTVNFRAGCSSCSMTNGFVTNHNAVLIERAVSCWHLHELISQTTQYLDNWLPDLL